MRKNSKKKLPAKKYATETPNQLRSHMNDELKRKHILNKLNNHFNLKNKKCFILSLLLLIGLVQ